MDKTTKTILITVLSFGAYFVLDELFFKGLKTWLNDTINQIGVSHLVAYLIIGMPIYAGVLLLHPYRHFFYSLGLDQSILKGVLRSLFFTLPMFIGFAVVFEFNADITLNKVLVTVIAAGFFEELFFRGFLFGQLYRYAKLGFIPSILFGALLFAVVHLYQSQDFYTLVGIFAVTFLGALFFAWLYAEWDFNLWVPVCMHLFMNLSWLLFAVSDNALGGVYANVFRVLTIALAISFTVIYKRKRKMEVNRRTIWIKREQSEGQD